MASCWIYHLLVFKDYVDIHVPLAPMGLGLYIKPPP